MPSTRIKEFATTLPLGIGRTGLIRHLTQARKTIAFVHPALANELHTSLTREGVSAFLLVNASTEAKTRRLNQFKDAESGILITTIHHNLGYQFDDASLVIFLELHVTLGSAPILQAIARARAADVQVLYLNCFLKAANKVTQAGFALDFETLPLRVLATTHPAYITPRLVLTERPPKRGRTPDIQFKAGAWRVRIGKWTNTFPDRPAADRFAVHHHDNSTDDNWQRARWIKHPKA